MKKINLLVFALFLITSHSFAQTTWNKNISCIIYSHCTGCHNPNGLAPFSLTTYNEVYNYRNSLVSVIESRKMPPHLPDPNYTHFAGENVLTASEIQLIKDWVNNNAPEGTASPIPEPVYEQSEVLTNPDARLKIPTFQIPNTGNDLYQAFVISNPSPTVKYISKIEVVPGNRNIVHHVLVFQDTSYRIVANDSSYNGPGYLSFGGVGSNSAKLIGTWVPGSGITEFPTGMGIKLDAGSRIVVQIHYPNGSAGQTDSTKFNIQYSNSALRNVNITPILNNNNLTNGPLDIPANTTKTFYAQYTVPVNVTVVSVGPHAHLLCKSFECYGIPPSGDTIKFIKINDWDFHWQGGHNFQKPIKIPAGTVLHSKAFYDNTTNNPENPNNPPQRVTLGEATTDEMMLIYFGFLLYQNGDENIIVDSAVHLKHYLDCDAGIQIDNGQSIKEIIVYPNPAHNNIKINIPNNTIFSTDIYNSTGQLVSRTSNQDYLNIEKLNSGIYFVKIKYNNTVVTKRIVKH
jgi:Secretion system C-terminal sorting domain/Copper type II ascorbate-dependent monooxygenase, N-terminal domain